MADRPKVETLVIKDNMVDCPKAGGDIDFQSCRECLDMRMHTSSTSDTGSDEVEGVIICEYNKYR